MDIMERSREELHEGAMNKQAEYYYSKYRKQMDLLEKSILCKVRGGLQAQDVYALGKQLESFDAYKQLCEEEGSISQLGQIPKVAYDVITATYGVSILPIIASVQPIDEERGNVYFKNIRSSSTKGSQTAGQVITDPRSQIVTPSGYASNDISAEVLGATGATPGTSYSFTMAAAPVRPQTVQISIQNDNVNYCQDDGNGKLIGVGVYGSINYLTGLCQLTFAVAPAMNMNIFANYQQNYELSTDIPQIDQFFDSKGILAKIYALKGTVGMLQAFGMKKRFGMVAEDELAKDLVQEINREVGGDLIRKMRSQAVGSTLFSKTPPSANISYFEHKQTYKDQMAVAESTLVGNAGRGTISLLIVGKDHAAVLQTLPGWKKMFDGNSLGAHLYGELDGVPVVRVMEQNIIAGGQGIAVWKGTSPFEAAAVYSPFMPLAVTSTLPQAPNPLQSMKAAAVWAGTDVLVPNYCTNFDVTA
jgi:hypothetical protein